MLGDYASTDRPFQQARYDEVKTWICLENITADAVIANPDADFFIVSTSMQQVESHADKVKRYFDGRSAEGLYALERVYNLSEDKLNAYLQLGFTVENIEEVFINQMDANQTAIFITLSYEN